MNQSTKILASLGLLFLAIWKSIEATILCFSPHQIGSTKVSADLMNSMGLALFIFVLIAFISAIAIFANKKIALRIGVIAAIALGVLSLFNDMLFYGSPQLNGSVVSIVFALLVSYFIGRTKASVLTEN